MVTAGDGGASLTARSERGAAGAALGGRGERAEKADSGAPQPHIEGTLIYVIARCLPGTDVVVTRHAEQRGGVAKSWLDRGGPRPSGNLAGTQCGVPLGARGYRGRVRRVHPGHAGTGRDLRLTRGLPLESPPGCGPGVTASSSRRAAVRPAARVPTPFSERKCQQNWVTVVRHAAEPAGTTGRRQAGVPGLRHPGQGCPRTSPVLGGEGDVVGTDLIVGSESRSLRQSWPDKSSLACPAFGFK